MTDKTLHVIEPARLKPGVTLDTLPGPKATDLAGATESTSLLRGRALIFWDPKRPGKKRDAIDTDQITPAADCVSESLETLDERWKAGSFRYLMPDFRQRVHAGATFVIAGAVLVASRNSRRPIAKIPPDRRISSSFGVSGTGS